MTSVLCRLGPNQELWWPGAESSSSSKFHQTRLFVGKWLLGIVQRANPPSSNPKKETVTVWKMYTKSWNVGHQFKSKVSHISGQLWTRCFRAFQGVPGVPMPTRTNPKCPETNQGQSGPTRIDQDQPGPDKSKLGNWHSVLKCGTLSWKCGTLSWKCGTLFRIGVFTF